MPESRPAAAAAAAAAAAVEPKRDARERRPCSAPVPCNLQGRVASRSRTRPR